MSRSSTRRFYRRVFRRLRIYLPLLLLLLLVMAVFLPISAGWLARTAEKQAKELTGLDLELDKLEVTVAHARVEAFGVELPAPDGASAFRVGRVLLDGNLDGLLAGGEKWPDQVVVDDLPTLELRRGDDGRYQLVGAYKSLVEIIKGLGKKGIEEKSSSVEKKATSEKKLSVGRTPELLIRELPIEVDAPLPDLPPVRFQISEIRVLERPSRQSPYRLGLKGTASTGTVEQIRLDATFFPNDNRGVVQGQISGITIPFNIPPLGKFYATAHDLSVNGQVTPSGEGIILASLNVRAERWEIHQAIQGGEYWEDEGLDLRIQAAFDLQTHHLDLREFSLKGQQVDVVAGGEVLLAEDFPGKAQLNVRRLPVSLLALGRNELAERLDIRVEQAGTSPTLRMDVAVDGTFARPQDLATTATLQLGGWSVLGKRIPKAMVIDNLEVAMTQSRVDLRQLKGHLGKFNFDMAALVPLTIDEPNGSVTIQATGNAESLVNLAIWENKLPAEISSLNMPINLDLYTPVTFSLSETGRPKFDWSHSESRATFSWLDGSIQLRAMEAPVVIEPGAINFADNELSLKRLRLRNEELDLNFSAKLSGPFLDGDLASSRIETSVMSTGNIPGLIERLKNYITLPTLPPDLDGGYHCDVQVSGELGDLDALEYQLRLVLSDGSVAVDIPYKRLPLREINLELLVSNNRVEIKGGKVRLETPLDPECRASFEVMIDEEKVHVDVSARTRLEVLPTIIVKDLSQVYMEGILPAKGWAEIVAQEALPEGPDLVRRWIKYVSKPGLSISRDSGADLKFDMDILYKQESPISVFSRELPVRMDNIRGNARLVPRGIVIEDLQADLGSAKDVFFKTGEVLFGRPLRINFDVKIDHLDVNEWLGGWGSQEWASDSASISPSWKKVPEPYNFVRIDAMIRTGSLDFLQFKGGETSSEFHFEAWSRRPPMMNLTNLTAEFYEGKAIADIKMVFPPGERPLLWTKAKTEAVNLDSFLDVFLERDQTLDGYLDSEMVFSGQLLNYPTFTGNGSFTINSSTVIGTVIFQYAAELFKNISKGGKRSVIMGDVTMAHEEIHFSRLIVDHPRVRLLSDGYIDFDGNLFFDVLAEFMGKQIRNIPILNLISKPIDWFGNSLIMYQVRGKLKEPSYKPIPTIAPHLIDTLKALPTFGIEETPDSRLKRLQELGKEETGVKN
jgi:hypothetical protein